MVSKLYQKVRWQKEDWVVLKRAREHVPARPCYYMAQPITGEIGDGGRGKCVLGEHVIRSSDPSICFQLCSKNKNRYKDPQSSIK